MDRVVRFPIHVGRRTFRAVHVVRQQQAPTQSVKRHYHHNHKHSLPLSSASSWILRPVKVQQGGLSASFSTTTMSTNTRSNINSPTPILTLYQYAICPYCNIAKTLLNYYQFPYHIIEVNPLTKAELKKDSMSKDYRKVPILTFHPEPQEDSMENNSKEEHHHTNASMSGRGTILQLTESQQPRQWNGSEAIVEFLTSTSSSSTTLLPVVDTTSESSLYWTRFAREDLAPLLYPNVCDTWRHSFHAFDYVHRPSRTIVNHYDNPTTSTATNTTILEYTNAMTPLQKTLVQWIGSVAMYWAASKVKKRRNISNAQDALRSAVNELEQALGKMPSSDPKDPSSVVFLSGTQQPHLGDLTTYGVLRALQGLPVFDNVMKDHTKMASWYQSVARVVEPTPHQN